MEELISATSFSSLVDRLIALELKVEKMHHRMMDMFGMIAFLEEENKEKKLLIKSRAEQKE